MKESQLESLDPESVSNVTVSFKKGPATNEPYRGILVIAFKGEYRIGSQGNPDANYMHAKGDFGADLYHPSGIILDLRELDYKWGDELDYIWMIGNKHSRREIPRAVILGADCREAIGTLFHGVNSTTPATTEEWIFDSFDEAWKYVDDKIS